MRKLLAPFFKEGKVMASTAVEILNQIGETAGSVYRSLEIRIDHTIADL